MNKIQYKISDYIYCNYWSKYLKAVMKRKIEKLYKRNTVYMLGSGQVRIPELKNLDKELKKWYIDVKLYKKV